MKEEELVAARAQLIQMNIVGIQLLGLCLPAPSLSRKGLPFLFLSRSMCLPLPFLLLLLFVSHPRVPPPPLLPRSPPRSLLVKDQVSKCPDSYLHFCFSFCMCTCMCVFVCVNAWHLQYYLHTTLVIPPPGPSAAEGHPFIDFFFLRRVIFERSEDCQPVT